MHKALFGEGPAHNALCHPGGPCAQRFVSWDGVCVTPCVAQRLVSPRGGRCTTPCVTGCAQRLVSPGGGACAQGLVSQRGRGVCLWLSGSSNGLLTCQSWAQIPGGPCAQRLVSLGGVCATPCDVQRLVSPRGGRCTTPCVRGCLCTTPCVTAGGPAHNALCRATPCVTEGGSVHNALCHVGGGAQRGPCVAQRLVSPGPGWI